MAQFTVCVTDGRYTFFLKTKNGCRCTHWADGPKSERAAFDSREEAEEKANKLNQMYKYGGLIHRVVPLEV